MKKSREQRNKHSAKTATGDNAFDVWLERGLHQLYDNVADEPIPDELLRLIEDDRNVPHD